MTKFAIGTIVDYRKGNSNYKYEIITNEIIDNKVENLHFGKDDNGNVLHTATGIFDYVLAEYDEEGEFIRNLTCIKDDIEGKV